MSPFKYCVHPNGAGFAWQVLNENGEIIAKGHEPDSVKARAAAMLAAIRLRGSEEDPRYLGSMKIEPGTETRSSS